MKRLIFKSFLFVIIYTIFHFGEDVIAIPIFANSESIWQHLKIGFFSGIILSLIEWAYYTVVRYSYDWYNFILSRLISAQLIAGVIFSLFYLYTGLFHKLPGGTTEIVLVVILTYVAGFIAYYLEGEIYENFTGQSRLLLVICFIFLIINAYLFITYSYEVPYYPLFTERII